MAEIKQGYRRDGKFVELVIPIQELEIKNTQKKKKPVIEFVNKYENLPIRIVGWDKIGQLSDYLELPRMTIKNLVTESSPKSIGILNRTLKESEKGLVKINASMDKDNNLWIYAISTTMHIIITFTQIRKLVNEILVPAGKVEETEGTDKMRIWDLKLKTEETSLDKFDVEVEVISGKNNMDSAVKVMCKIRVHSCNNSVRCATFQAIKRTTNCIDNVKYAIENALKVANVCLKVLSMNAEQSITLESGLKYIDSIEFAIKTPEKIAKIKELLKRRFEYEYATHPTKFGLSQALSFIGTKETDESLTDFAQEQLQSHAYEVFTADFIEN